MLQTNEESLSFYTKKYIERLEILRLFDTFSEYSSFTMFDFVVALLRNCMIIMIRYDV